MRRVLVYDPVLRLIHGWNALVVVALLASSQIAKALAFTPDEALVWRIHVWAGYGLTLGLVGRLTWGMVGPLHARFSDMWHPKAWLQAARHGRIFTISTSFGHHPIASAVYLGVYVVLLVSVATGLALAAIEQTTGPLVPMLADAVWERRLFKVPHDAMETVVIAFLVFHIAALALHRWIHGVPIAQSMFTGYQYSVVEK